VIAITIVHPPRSTAAFGNVAVVIHQIGADIGCTPVDHDPLHQARSLFIAGTRLRLVISALPRSVWKLWSVLLWSISSGPASCTSRPSASQEGWNAEVRVVFILGRHYQVQRLSGVFQPEPGVPFVDSAGAFCLAEGASSRVSRAVWLLVCR